MFSLVNFYSVCISSQFMLLDIKKALFPTSFCLALKSSGGHQCILEWQNQLNNRVTGAYGRASQPRGIYLWSPHSSRLLFASRGGPPRVGGCFECRFSDRSRGIWGGLWISCGVARFLFIRGALLALAGIFISGGGLSARQ